MSTRQHTQCQHTQCQCSQCAANVNAADVHDVIGMQTYDTAYSISISICICTMCAPLQVPQTPRLDHPRFQPTFLREIARTQSMELLQEGRQVASPPAPSTRRSPHVTFGDEIAAPLGGSHSNFTLQGGQRIPHSRSFESTPNVHQSSSDHRLQTHLQRPPPVHVVQPLTVVPQSQPAHVWLPEHHQVQLETRQPWAPSPAGGYRTGQNTELLRPPAASPTGPYHVGYRLRSVHEVEELDVWPDGEEPPRYSHLFGEHESSHQKQHGKVNKIHVRSVEV